MRQTTSVTLHSRTYGHLKHAPESNGSGENYTDVTTGNYSYDPPYTKLNQPRNDKSTSLTLYCSRATKLDHGTTGQGRQLLSPSCTTEVSCGSWKNTVKLQCIIIRRRVEKYKQKYSSLSTKVNPDSLFVFSLIIPPFFIAAQPEGNSPRVLLQN